MDTTLYISFLIVSFGLIIIPGPNVLVIVSTSITHGRAKGLQTVAGTTLAMAIQLVIAITGTAGLLKLFAEGFYILKWLGVAYLIYLGIQHLKKAYVSRTYETELSSASTFTRGFIVSLTNPKTILFFAAFLPQFVSPAESYIFQITILSITFLTLAALLDSCYAVLASKFMGLFRSSNISRFQHGIAGVLYLGVSTWIAAAHRS